MSRKLALIVTTALTTFVLITVIALGTLLGTSNTSAQEVPVATTEEALEPATEVTAVATEVPTNGIDAEIVQQREKAYRQRLEEANARLQELQDQNAALLDREAAYRQEIQKANDLLAQNVGPSVEIPQENQSIISADEAVSIARLFTDGGTVREIELEQEHGATVYEIEIGSSEIYVDAYSGDILYTSDEHDDDDDHDDDDHDDDDDDD